MKRLLSILTSVVFTTYLMANNSIVVNTTQDLINAVSTVKPGDTILIADGTYRNLRLSVTTDGTNNKMITIKAQNPGKAYISGNSAIELRGDYIHLSGLYFKDGSRNPGEWKTHGPGIVSIYADHCEVSECLFYDFDKANSSYISTNLDESGHVPQYCHIHHCAFIGKTTQDQVINLNNTRKKTLEGEPGKPMYHRISYCYFSNPPKKGNAGGGIRIGYWRKDYGRCLIDHNLFERQDSEAEIVTSKSMENVYFANTFINCRGTLNFRHGDKQVALNNIFIGTDEMYGYGGMYIWGSNHIIGNNFFYLPKTMKDRGFAGIYFNCGPKAGEHALAYDMVVVSNTFVAVQGSAFNLAPMYDRRLKAFGAETELPHDITFVNNYVSAHNKTKSVWHEENGNSSKQTWEDNVCSGLDVSGMKGWENGTAPKGISTEGLKKILPYTSIEGIDLDFLKILSTPLQDKPLNKKITGPSWCDEYPGNYAETGIFAQ